MRLIQSWWRWMRLFTLIYRREQHQPAGWGIREPAPDVFLLPGDDLGGGLGDRQAPSVAGVLVVVVDEYRAAIAVAGQAAEGQGGDLSGAAPRVDQQLDPGADLGPARAAFQVAELHGEGAHDLGGQVPAWFGPFGRLRHVPGGQHEAVGKPGGRLAGRGLAEGTDAAQRPPGGLADPGPVVPAELPGRFQVGQVVEERFDVAAAERGRQFTVITPGGVQVC